MGTFWSRRLFKPMSCLNWIVSGQTQAGRDPVVAEQRHLQPVPRLHQLRDEGRVLLREAEPARLAGHLHRVQSRPADQAQCSQQVSQR